MAAFTTDKLVKLGTKQVFLPKFTIALMRPPPNLSPYHARFLVPLDIGKLDLRDYLFHAYNIRAVNIRSYVEQQKVCVSDDAQGRYRRWHRPRAKKYMTVEMDRPFVWPEEPTDWEPWGKKELEEPRPIDRYAGGKRKPTDAFAKEEGKVREIKAAKKEAMIRQAELAKRRVEAGVSLPRVSFAQAVNAPGMKIKI
jgi:large subunit ribosomal protein L23